MIRKLVIIRVKAVTMSQLSWCVSRHRVMEREPELIRETSEKIIRHGDRQTEDGERERKCVEEIQVDRREASSDTPIPITLIPQRYQIWGTWAGDGSP